MTESDLSAQKKFFSFFLKPSVLYHRRPKKFAKKNFRTVRVLSAIFSKIFSISVVKMGIKNSVWTTDINFNDDNLQDPPIKYCTVGGLVLIITVYS